MNQAIEAVTLSPGLGDVRRVRRLRKMLATLSRRPAGKISEVFRRPAERQAAYDALEHCSFAVGAVQAMAYRETAALCRGISDAFLILDGSSVSLTDGEETKFGAIGTRQAGGRDGGRDGVHEIGVLCRPPALLPEVEERATSLASDLVKPITPAFAAA